MSLNFKKEVIENIKTKKRKKKSAIWTIEKSDLQNLINQSSSLKEVIEKISSSLQPRGGGSYKTLNKRILEENLDISLLEKRRISATTKRLTNITKIPNEQIFIENSSYYNNGGIKKILIKEGWEEKCILCGLRTFWNGKKLSIQLDHINGDSKDNRRSNLRFLCPNCHTQTPTFGSKRRKLKKERIKKPRPRKFNPSKDELTSKIEELNSNICAVGRYYNVSDNAIRKRMRILEIKVGRGDRTPI